MLVAHHKIKVSNTEMKIPPSPHGQDKTAENESSQNTDSEHDNDFRERVLQISKELSRLAEHDLNIFRLVDMADDLWQLCVDMPLVELPAAEQDDEMTASLDEWKSIFPEAECRIVNKPVQLIRASYDLDRRTRPAH
jgi:hypothetical protein